MKNLMHIANRCALRKIANGVENFNLQSLQVEVTLRPAVSLGVRPPSGTRDQFYSLLEIFFRQLQLKLKLKLIYDQQSVGQSVLVSGAHLGPVTNFSFARKVPLDSCGFGMW
jgi:hypothetical protein